MGIFSDGIRNGFYCAFYCPRIHLNTCQFSCSKSMPALPIPIFLEFHSPPFKSTCCLLSEQFDSFCILYTFFNVWYRASSQAQFTTKKWLSTSLGFHLLYCFTQSPTQTQGWLFFSCIGNRRRSVSKITARYQCHDHPWNRLVKRGHAIAYRRSMVFLDAYIHIFCRACCQLSRWKGANFIDFSLCFLPFYNISWPNNAATSSGERRVEELT